ncbi:ABC transporter domain-containing protein [Caenorhabditis elegans]|uniref:ABC transporter domain-containing protein n=4 Tax=Caenorhabditis elegans TaxID=6239 RepID=H2L028_CAEEL|nr:ABC transporter domain-containing protein [Caenorhabditis elegans]CCD71158.2 ABC transporter domain-containing protein [Caenorhabditis elegans]
MLKSNVIQGSIESMSVVDSTSDIDKADKSFMEELRPKMLLTWHDISVSDSSEDYSSNSGLFGKCCPIKVGDVEKMSVEKRILDSVFGVARPGEVTAIIGPSGAGKTTLLNVLTKRNLSNLKATGSVKVNGIRAERSYMRQVCAYVQQDDCFIGSLTVEEHLKFMAKLKMGSEYDLNEQERRVKSVMRSLGLEKIADSIIGTRTRKGISGGEKKRLAFASEILTSPPILICDEPTSGLDSFLAYQVVCVLKKLAETRNMTILLTIHQPSSQVFQLFDSIYMMVNGDVAFCGSQSGAEKMWSEMKLPIPMNFNPSDHYLATMSIRDQAEETLKKNQIGKICTTFKYSELGKSVFKESSGREVDERDRAFSEDWRRRYATTFGRPRFGASFFQQIRALTWRASKTVLREPTLLKVQTFQSIIIAILTGLVYTNNSPVDQQKIMNINGSLYQMISNMAFMFQFSVVHHFCLEMNTFYRETSSRLYRVSAYFISKNLAELPSYIVSAVIFTSILYWMSGLVPIIDSFLIYMLVGILVQNIAISIGYMFSCIFGTVNLAVAVMPIFVVPMMAFGGFFINQDTLQWYFVPMKYLSYFGYGYEAVAIAQWTHVEEIPGCSSSLAHCSRNGTDVLNSMSFKPSNFWVDISVMAFMIFVFRFLAFMALYVRVKRRS